MTLLRRVAMMISGAVARYASPGCKEWAEGLAREVAFIPGDWAALRWALGSTRVLLDRREATVRSLSEAVAKAWQFSELRRKGRENTGYWVMFSQAFLYMLRFLDARGAQQRIACGVATLAAIYMGVYLLRMKRTLSDPPDSEDARVWILYYKTELVRLCGTGFFVNFFLPMGLMVGGVAFSGRGGARAHPLFATTVGSIFMAVTAFFSWKRRQFQHQIAALDAVLEEMG